MVLHTIALDLLAVGIMLSLVSIVLFVMVGCAVSVLTVAGARRQRRRLAARIDWLPGLSANKELAEIDEALERILSEERAAFPGRTS